jgi:multiple sugar transport system permease protein
MERGFIMNSSTEISSEVKNQPEGIRNFMKKLTPYFFIAPHLLFFTVFLIVPTVYGIYISFHEWNFFDNPTFIGLQNYADILVNKDSLYYPYFWKAFKATLLFVILSVPFLIIVPLFIAIAMDTKPFGNNIFRTLFYAPSMLSVATVVLIWIWMLDTNAGLVNFYLEELGIAENIPWLTGLPWAWVSLVVMTVWWTMGYNMIIFLAGLQEVPQHLYEAAKIDGANGIQRFWHITLPGIRGPMLFVVVMTTLASFNVFGQPFMATGGGPGSETKVLMMYIREISFTGGNPKAGLGSAMAIVMGFFMVIISVIQFYFLNKKDKPKKTAIDTKE